MLRVYMGVTLGKMSSSPGGLECWIKYHPSREGGEGVADLLGGKRMTFWKDAWAPRRPEGKYDGL